MFSLTDPKLAPRSTNTHCVQFVPFVVPRSVPPGFEEATTNRANNTNLISDRSCHSWFREASYSPGDRTMSLTRRSFLLSSAACAATLYLPRTRRHRHPCRRSGTCLARRDDVGRGRPRLGAARTQTLLRSPAGQGGRRGASAGVGSESPLGGHRRAVPHEHPRDPRRLRITVRVAGHAAHAGHGRQRPGPLR